MGKLRSNRVKRTPQTGITSDRYQFLGLEQAEPNLGDPTVGPSSVGVNPIKVGLAYQNVSINGHIGERFWTPLVGFGTTVGVISVYANGTLVNNDNRFQTINGLNFVGTGVTVESLPTEGPFQGVGIATVRFTVTDIQNRGQIGQVLYNTPSGYAYGADDLYYVSGNVGIGSTLPRERLDVSGNGYFIGTVTAATFIGEFAGTATTAKNVIGGIASVTSLYVSGISTLGVTSATDLTSKTLVVSGISTLGVTSATDLTSETLVVSGISTLGVTSATNLTSKTLNVSGISTLGVTSATDLTSKTLVVSGISTLGVTSATNLTSETLVVSGISTLGVTSATNLTSKTLNVSGISTLGPIQISTSGTTGIVSVTSGITTLFYYGDGSKLEHVVASRFAGITTVAIFTNNEDKAQYLTFVAGAGIVTQFSVDTNIGLVFNPSTERLGIGTTNPKATLDVGFGSVHISNGDFRLNGTSYIFNTRNVGGDYISNGGTDGILNVVNITPGGPIGLSVKIPGVGATVGTFEEPNTANLYTTMSTKHDGTQAISYFNGLLGIGTTVPTSTVHIVGNGVPTEAALQVDGNIRVGISTTSNYIAFRGVQGDGVGETPPVFQPPYTHAYIGERIYVPGTEISELLLFKGNDADTAGNGPDRIRLAGVGGVVFDTCDRTSFSSTFEGVGVSTYLTTKMALTQVGNLGIGITNPTSRLHISSAGITTGEALQVDGNIRVGISTTSNYIAFRGTYGDGVNAQGGDQIPPTTIAYTHTYIGERIYDYSGAGEKSELLLFKGNGSLDASGPDRIRLAATGGIVFDTSTDILKGTFEEVGTSSLLSTKMALTQVGNLGIGTTVPTSKLHVQGEVRVTGLSTFGGNILPSTPGLTIGDPDNKWDKLHVNTIFGNITGAASSITVSQDSSSNNVNYISFVDATSGISSLRTNSSLVYTPSSGNLGIGTTNALTPIQVERYGVKTGFGTFVASAGITTDVDSFLITNTNFKTAEYTIHIESSSSIQAQKVLVMQNGISAFSQEYAVMYNPTLMVSIGATVSGGLCKLQFTPESGISGIMTYRFTRQSMI
jgi:hypothetical protein